MVIHPLTTAKLIMAPRPELNLVDQVMASARNFYGRITLLISLIILYNFHESWLLIRFKYLFIYISHDILYISPNIYIYLSIYLFILFVYSWIFLFMCLSPFWLLAHFRSLNPPISTPLFIAPRATAPCPRLQRLAHPRASPAEIEEEIHHQIPYPLVIRYIMLDHVRSIKVHINPYQSWLPSGELT
jgi:hypothetical protein